MENCTVLADAYGVCNETLGLLLAESAAADPCIIDSSQEYGQALHLGAIFIVLVAAALGAGIPLVAKHHPGFYIDPYVICLGKCMGTGVVLACGLVHMLQPSNQSLTSPCVPWEFNTDYQAYAFLFAMLAGLAMQFVEVVVGFAIGEHPPANQARGAMASRFPEHNHGSDANCLQSNDQGPSGGADFAVERVAASAQGSESPPSKALSSASLTGVGAKDLAVLDCDAEKGRGGGPYPAGDAPKSLLHRLLSVYLIEFSVTVHSVFIGLATGVVALDELQVLLCALCFHQFFEGVALGARLADANLPSHWQEGLLLLVFSVAAPIGLAVGVGVTYSFDVAGETFLLVQGTFDGVCGGLLLYLGYSLLLQDFPADMRKYCAGRPNEVARRGGMFVALWLGAGLMAFIGKYL